MSGADSDPPVERAATGAMGSGYAQQSGVQHSAESYAMPMLRRAVDAVVLPASGSPFRVADLGAAAGTNSLQPMRVVVDGVRARAGERVPVTVVHTDILANDFDVLLANVMSTPGSYATEPDVFAFAEARSFYERLIPAGDLHLAWSAIAVHWVSRVPEPIPDHIFSTRAHGRVRAALEQQARRDWVAFLTHRADELAPGGQLVVVGGAADDDGSSGAEALMDTANAVLTEMVSDGQLGAAEYARMSIPTWNRTQAEFLAPLRDGPLAQAWTLEEHELLRAPDTLLEEYERSGDAGAFAAAVVDFFDAAFMPSLLSALDSARSPDQTDAFVSEFKRRFAERIASDPPSVETHWHVLLLRLTRRPGR
ncbi:hypothetical protein [Microbacterium sp.]|uniref:hypothetical protein n=1 Tax=Microbacterium sp. TaxID=51671 RepID=UPI002D79CFA4|nr:hypothetical protein [Microbacterium sp.]HET6301208.1 hypothetical protein [Microbacterium sp.]